MTTAATTAAPLAGAHTVTAVPSSARAVTAAPGTHVMSTAPSSAAAPHCFTPEDADLLPAPPAAPAHITLSHLVDAEGGVVTVSVGPPVGQPSRVRLVCLLDISGSMAGPKLDMLQRTLLALLDELGPQDRLALVTFNDTGRIAMPLRAMHDANKAAASAVIGQLCAAGGTSIRQALVLAEGILHASQPLSSVSACILLSDGRDMVSHPQTTTAAAAALGARGPVYTLGIGEDHDYGVRREWIWGRALSLDA